MSTPKHTPEPWAASYNGLYMEIEHEGFYFIAVFGNDHSPLTRGSNIQKANADRIVACVNALAGIEDPEAFVQQAKAAINKDKFPFT